MLLSDDRKNSTVSNLLFVSLRSAGALRSFEAARLHARLDNTLETRAWLSERLRCYASKPFEQKKL